MFADGMTAGYFCSVIGPGRNLDLATDATHYYYRWVDDDPDYLVFNDETSYPGRLPEPVTLVLVLIRNPIFDATSVNVTSDPYAMMS